jgi:hypothetical protein
LRLLAVDPGIRGCGAALFEDRELVKAGYVKNGVKEGDNPKAILSMALELMNWIGDWWKAPFYYKPGEQELVIEWPQVYRAGKLKGDPNDLLPLAGIGCALGAYLELHGATVRYLPREWKGQLPKDVVQRRVIERLSLEEVANIELAGARSHNIYDAVGLGLFHLKRFDPRRGRDVAA